MAVLIRAGRAPVLILATMAASAGPRRRVVRTGDRHVHVSAVGRRRHPVGSRANLHRADVLQIGQRPSVDPAVQPARRPHRRTIRQHLETVHVAGLNAVRVLLPERSAAARAYRRPCACSSRSTQTALMPVACANIRLVEPSGLASNAIGRTSWCVLPYCRWPVSSMPQTTVSVSRVDHLDRRLTGLDFAPETGNHEVVIRRHVGVVDRMVDRECS